jgi:hypothetical protein
LKAFFDHKEFKKGELKDALKDDERQLREIQRQEERSGTTTSKDDDIYFRKKGGS